MPKKAPQGPKADGTFKDMKLFVLPSLIARKRLALFETQVRKECGQWLSAKDMKEGAKATHIVVDESLAKDSTKIRQLLQGLDVRFSPKDTVVTTGWLSACLKNVRLESVGDFSVKLNRSSEQENVSEKRAHSDSSGGNKSGKNEGCSRTVNVTVERAPSSTASDAEDADLRQKENEAEVNRGSEEGEISPKRPKLNPVPPDSKNDMIITELQKLADAFQSKGDTWRAHGYSKAISAIRRHDLPINSYEDAVKLPGIGVKMAEKVWELLECGSLRKVAEVCGDEKTRILELFTNVWGAGPSTAESWYRQGYRSLEDLKENAALTKQQQVGLKHFHDFTDRMSREEVERIASVVKEAALAVEPSVEVMLVGSYRRGKMTCGDVDVLIIRPDYIEPGHILPRVLDVLRNKGFITDDLVHIMEQKNQRKYLGVCRLPGEIEKHRRLDIFVAPRSEEAPAIMHFTGSALFNRTVRLDASKKGMSLSEHSLATNVIRQGTTVINEGQIVPTPTERSIFEALGMDYLEPHERNH